MRWDWVSNPGPLAHESDAIPIVLHCLARAGGGGQRLIYVHGALQ